MSGSARSSPAFSGFTLPPYRIRVASAVASGAPSARNAERSWLRAAELDPWSPEAALGLCVARAALGRCGDAAIECERCLRLAPADARCARSLAALEGCAPAPMAR